VTMEVTRSYNVKISRLEEEIRRFDTVLDSIQKLLPEYMGVYDHIVQVRDAMFRLQQSMRGCEIAEFACSGLDDITTATSTDDSFWRRDDD
jgi:hypothetical protein